MKTKQDNARSEYRRERDAKVNASTALPPGESVTVPALWVMEVFTPTMIANLRAGAEKLGWTSSELTLNPDFVDRVTDWRSSTGAGGTLNLGYIVPLGSSREIFGHREAPLPDGIRAIHGTVLQPFPSTTILCLQFQLDETLSSSLNVPLSEHFVSYDEPIGNTTYRSISVDHQKALAVETARAALHSICVQWVRQHFPGFFARHECKTPTPICELLLFAQAEEFHKKAGVLEPTYLEMLSLQDRKDTWHSTDLPGLYFLLRDETPSRVVLYGNINNALNDKKLDGYRGEKVEKLVNWLQYLDRTLGLWVLSTSTRELISQLGRARDAYGSVDVARPDDDASKPRQLDQAFLNIQRTALPYAYDLVTYCEFERHVLYDVFEFKLVNPFREEDRKLFAGVRQWLLYAAKQLRALEEQVRFISVQTTRQLSIAKNEELAQTNIRLQEQIRVMTLVMLILTAVMAIDPIMALWRFLTDIK